MRTQTLGISYRKLRLGGPFCNGPRTLEISKNGRRQKYPNLDFDRIQPNTRIRLLGIFGNLNLGIFGPIPIRKLQAFEPDLLYVYM